MRSLFKIDKNIVNNSTGVFVRLPNLEEMLEKEKRWQDSEDTALHETDADESEEERKYRKKREELENLERQLEEIKKEAQKLLEEAETQCVQIREKARAEAYEDAYKKASEEREEEREKERRDFKKLCGTIKEAAHEYEKEVERGILDVALTAAEKVLALELDRNDQAFLQIVRETSGLLHRDIRKDIHISPPDYRRYFSEENSVVKAELLDLNINIVEDTSLEEGDCLMVSEFGTVNAGAGLQLDKIKKALKEV